MSISRTLTPGQEKLLFDIYDNQVVKGIRPGIFREEHYKVGLELGSWNLDETMDLERAGLIKIDGTLHRMGDISPSITPEGRRYMEVMQAA
jgi:hypothetical protein